MKNLTVFASGRGSNFEAILRKIKSQKLKAHIALVVSNNPKAKIIETAKKNKIEVFLYTKDVSEKKLLKKLKEVKTDYIILAGYLKRISSKMIKKYPNKILNIHPALLPAFGGKGYYGLHVHEAVINSGVKYSGPTIHFVDEQYDHGAIVAQKVVPVLDTDDAQSLQKRVLKEEHKLFWKAIKSVVENKIKIQGKRVLSK